MKALFKALYLLLSLSLLFTQCDKINPENPVDIPEDAFLKALIELGIDENMDGLISYAETEVVTSLNVSSKEISDMKGIEAFIMLEELICDDNQLTSLDVSNNKVLGKKGGSQTKQGMCWLYVPIHHISC